MNHNNIGKLSLLLLLMIMGFSSCTKEARQAVDPILQESQSITVHFPGTTLGVRLKADPEEKSLKNVQILTFSDKNGQPDILLNRAIVTLSSGDTEQGVVGKFVLKHTGKVHLVAVANLDFVPDEWKNLDGKNFQEIAKKLVKQPAGVADAFAMSSEPVPVEVPTSGKVDGLTFHLIRLAVRVDVINQTTEEKGLFVMTGARLRGFNQNSYLLDNKNAKAPNDGFQYISPNETDSKDPASTLINGNYKETQDPLKLDKLYTYEDAPNRLHVEVKGTYKGVPAEFMIPFGDIQIDRNTCYLVILKNLADPADMEVEIVSVKDWQEGDLSKYKPSVDAEIPTLVKVDAVDKGGKVINANHSLNTSDLSKLNSISVNTPSEYRLQLTVNSKETDPRVILYKYDAPWLSVNHDGRIPKADGTFEHKFTLTLGQNADLFDRSIIVELQNSYLPDRTAPIRYTITQKGAATSTNPLAWMATSNVSSLNKFAPSFGIGGDVTLESMGKLYQSGRNMPFDLREYPKTLEKISHKALKVWTSQTWYGDGTSWAIMPINPESGYREYVFRDWISYINAAKEAGAPASYVGSNGGDPSPVGFHLGSNEELASIVPMTHSITLQGDRDLLLNFKGDVNQRSIPEKGILLKGKVVSEGLTSDFFSNQRGVVYAVRFKSESNEFTTYYKYEILNYIPNVDIVMKVTVRYDGGNSKPASIGEVSKASFWENNAGSDVVRYFPSGYKGSNDKLYGGYYFGNKGLFEAVGPSYVVGLSDWRERGSLLRPFKDR